MQVKPLDYAPAVRPVRRWPLWVALALLPLLGVPVGYFLRARPAVPPPAPTPPVGASAYDNPWDAMRNEAVNYQGLARHIWLFACDVGESGAEVEGYNIRRRMQPTHDDVRLATFFPSSVRSLEFSPANDVRVEYILKIPPKGDPGEPGMNCTVGGAVFDDALIRRAQEMLVHIQTITGDDPDLIIWLDTADRFRRICKQSSSPGPKFYPMKPDGSGNCVDGDFDAHFTKTVSGLKVELIIRDARTVDRTGNVAFVRCLVRQRPLNPTAQSGKSPPP